MTRTISRAELMAMHAPAPATPAELAAVRRLVDVAKSDTGQGGRAAGFLLAWWNAETCGGFDLTDLWSVDRVIADDMVAVVGMLARVHSYPDALLDAATVADFRALVAMWRPELVR